MKRVNSIDFIRGLVIIVMTLDHVRDLMHVTSIAQVPTDLNTTTPALFLTRWITHLCAPTFVFLSGTSAYLSIINKNNTPGTRNFLLSRGIWLIILDLTLVNFGVWFDVHFNVFLFNVLSAIGCGFIALSFLTKLSPKTIAIIGLAIIFLHNLSPFVPGAETTMFKKILMPFFSPGALPFGDGKMFVMGYPPVPWLGIMLVGFSAGKLFELSVNKRKFIFLKIGLSAICLCVLLRVLNLYGDSVAWSVQKNGLYSFLSFINLTKYPPSLQFCLLFLGIMFVCISLFEGMRNKLTNTISLYGKVPLFYFLIHWYIIHPLVFLMVFLQGYKTSDMVFGFNFGRPKDGSGIQLWLVYVVWIAVVIALYPICRWYGRYKQTYKYKWMRYL